MQREDFGFEEFASGNNPIVDIVAINAIVGDHKHSWVADNGVLWLKDLLPAKIPNARILGYRCDPTKPAVDQLGTSYMHDLAVIFISKLAIFRQETATNNRPIIFVAHSSGGLLLKSSLIYSHLCHDNHLKLHHAISCLTGGIAFFGTPQQGFAIAALARFILDNWISVTRTESVLQHIERDSEALEQQFAQYTAISSQFEIKFFYELYDTSVGKNSRRVVPMSSAIPLGVANAAVRGINKDHFHMVRFPSADDEDFRTVSTILYMMSKVAAMRKIVEEEGLYQSIAKEIILSPSQQMALSNFRSVNTARFDAANRPGCLEGTRVELLGKILEWAMARGGHQIFWLCGQVGTGKTTISSTVASTCNSKGHLGASFFFSRDDAERSDLRLVFPTIAYQLGIFHKPFQKSLVEVLVRDPVIAQMDPMYQFQKLILEPLKSCCSFPAPTIVVIDALDECKDEDPISRILSIIASHSHELLYLKFFITSRPEDHIRTGFKPLLSMTRTTILDVDKSAVIADIEHYLHNKLSNASVLYPYLLEAGWPSDRAIKSLAYKSGGLFIVAAAAINFILDRNYSDPPSQLAILLEQSSRFVFLDKLYLQVLFEAFPSNSTAPDRFALISRLITAIPLLRVPISPGALESLLELRRGIVRTTLRHLHSVIVVPDTDAQPILPLHPSFLDFIATSSSNDIHFLSHRPTNHKTLAVACFNQMKGLHRDICNIQDASKLNNEVEDLEIRIERYISPALQYACNHWAFHLCSAGDHRYASDNHYLQELLREFFHRQMLYWIEAVTLLGCLREGIRQLQDVLRFLNTPSLRSPPKDLLDALADNTQFMSDHFELISSSSLSLYSCALPYAALSSFLRQKFPSDLQGIQVFNEDWKNGFSGITTLLGSRGFLTSVGFSPDGEIITSTSGDEIRLWDRGTGTLLKMLRTESEFSNNRKVEWARFFPDGSRILSGTSGYSIQIWDVATGMCLQTIQLEKVDLECKTPSRYSCSPNFTRVVGSQGNNILVWDASDGVLLKVLEGHSKGVRFTEFFPDSRSIASAADDCSIRIWDAVTGATLWSLEGHSEPVVTIAFSPSGKRIISVSQDNNIRHWDATTGVGMVILTEHTGAVCSIALPPDEETVLLGSEDNTLLAWRVASGQLINTLRCPNAVRNVGFSPDGTQCIWSIQDTICLFDTDRFLDTDQYFYGLALDQIQLQRRREMMTRAMQRFQDMRPQRATRANTEAMPLGSTHPGRKAISESTQPFAQSQDLGDSVYLTSLVDVLPSSEIAPHAGTDTGVLETIEMEDLPWNDNAPNSIFLLDGPTAILLPEAEGVIVADTEIRNEEYRDDWIVTD